LDSGESGVPLGILPLGRGNDLAGSLGYPRGWRRALAALDGGRAAPLDVGRARLDGRECLFVNALGLGFDADVARRARRLRLPGPAAYVAGVAGAVAAAPGPWRLRGTVDGEPVDREVTLLSLGNGPTTGGGFRMTPDADPADGFLDACWAAAAPRRSILLMLPRVALGRHGSDPRITLSRCRRLDLQAEPPIPGHADGEVLPPARRIEVQLLPAALRVIRPVA
ncbi:MAG: sphingosine kinase, partial [Acidobacteria bacterium]